MVEPQPRRQRSIPAGLAWVTGLALAAIGIVAHGLYWNPPPLDLNLLLIGGVCCPAGLLLLITAAVVTVRSHRRPWVVALCATVLLAVTGGCGWSYLWLYRDYAMEDVRVESDDAVLAATIFVPHTARPCPGVVLVHGTSPDLRRSYLFYVDFFTSRGIAVIAYDKRGRGQSTGELEFTGLDGLAADTLACYRRLAAHPRVDPARVGIWGYSQGGAVGPLAAREAGDCAFLVSLSGPGTYLGEQMMHYHNKSPASEPPGALRDRVFQFYHDGAGYPELYADLQAVRGETWYGGCGFPPRLLTPEEFTATGHWPFAWMGPYMNHDPLPVIAGLDCPVAFFYGERDSIVPVAECLRRIDSVVKGPGRDVTVFTYPTGGHSLEDHTRYAEDGWPAYVPGYLEDLDGWLTAKVLTGE